MSNHQHRCMWIRPIVFGSKKFKRCTERSRWILDGTEYCDTHLEQVYRYNPLSIARARKIKIELKLEGAIQ